MVVWQRWCRLVRVECLAVLWSVINGAERKVGLSGLYEDD